MKHTTQDPSWRLAFTVLAASLLVTSATADPVADRKAQRTVFQETLSQAPTYRAALRASLAQAPTLSTLQDLQSRTPHGTTARTAATPLGRPSTWQSDRDQVGGFQLNFSDSRNRARARAWRARELSLRRAPLPVQSLANRNARAAGPPALMLTDTARPAMQLAALERLARNCPLPQTAVENRE